MILGPDGMKQIGVMGVPMMIYVVLQVPASGVKTILTSSSGTMRADAHNRIISLRQYQNKFVNSIIDSDIF